VAFHAAIVRCEDDVGVLDEFMPWPSWVICFLQVLEELADIMIEHFDHGTVKRVGLAFAQPVLLRVFGQFDTELLHILVEEGFAAVMNGSVDEPGGVVEEEGAVFVSADKFQCVVAVLMKGETIFVESEGVIGFSSGETGHPVRLHWYGGSTGMTSPVEADILRLGKGVVVDGDVPLPGMPRGVATCFEGTGQGVGVLRHPATEPWGHHGPAAKVMRGGWGTTDDMGFLCPGWMDAAHDGTTGGSTRRGGRVRLPELDPFPGQGVNVRGLHGAGVVNVVAFDVLPAEIIGQDEDDVGLFRSGFGNEGCQRSQHEQNEDGKGGCRFGHG